MLSEEEMTLIADAAKGWGKKHGAFGQANSSFAEEGAAAWDELVALGFAGALISEPYGGSEIGLRATGRIMAEMGRSLATSPFLSTAILAADLITRCGSSAQRQFWLPSLVEGSRFAVGVGSGTSTRTLNSAPLVAVREGDGWCLNGTKAFIRDGDTAEFLLASAQDGDSDPFCLALFVIPVDRASRKTGKLADGSGIATFEFHNVLLEAEMCLSSDASEAIASTLDLGRLMVSAEMLGAADSAFELTLDYLKQRRQFGQAIGSFQALQHRAAWMFVRLELARSCVQAALDGADESRVSAKQTALASYQAKSAINLVTREMIQMHGGVGMTTANPAGLFLKRARVLECLLGGRGDDGERYAELSGV